MFSVKNDGIERDIYNQYQHSGKFPIRSQAESGEDYG